MTARALAKRAVRLGANQKVDELTRLIRLLKRRRLETVVEIGTARGGTLAAWCALAQPDAVLVSIDLPGGRTAAATASGTPRATARLPGRSSGCTSCAATRTIPRRTRRSPGSCERARSTSS
jgi:hypothetical protein